MRLSKCCERTLKALDSSSFIVVTKGNNHLFRAKYCVGDEFNYLQTEDERDFQAGSSESVIQMIRRYNKAVLIMKR